MRVFACFFFSPSPTLHDAMSPESYAAFILVHLLLMCILHQECNKQLNNQIVACGGVW
jgi:hypothetical protein